MKKYGKIATPHGFTTRLADELGKSRQTVMRALEGLFDPCGVYAGNFIAIREKACEMLNIDNTDKE